MRKILLWYFGLGVVWFLWSNSQGYSTGLKDTLLWPFTLFRQIRDKNATA